MLTKGPPGTAAASIAEAGASPPPSAISPSGPLSNEQDESPIASVIDSGVFAMKGFGAAKDFVLTKRLKPINALKRNLFYVNKKCFV